MNKFDILVESILLEAKVTIEVESAAALDDIQDVLDDEFDQKEIEKNYKIKIKMEQGKNGILVTGDPANLVKFLKNEWSLDDEDISSSYPEL